MIVERQERAAGENGRRRDRRGPGETRTSGRRRRLGHGSSIGSVRNAVAIRIGAGRRDSAGRPCFCLRLDARREEFALRALLALAVVRIFRISPLAHQGHTRLT